MCAKDHIDGWDCKYEDFWNINLDYSPCSLQRRRNTKATVMNGSNRSKAAALLLCTCDPMKKERTNPLAQKTVSNRLSRCSDLYSQGLYVLKRLAKFLLERATAVELEPKIAPGTDNARCDLEQH